VLITRAATYKEIYETFRWNVPERFNMAVACCDRWAAESDRVALIHEAPAGTARRYTFRDLQRASKRVAIECCCCSASGPRRPCCIWRRGGPA
jgi:acetyl-CoA synthetase